MFRINLVNSILKTKQNKNKKNLKAIEGLVFEIVSLYPCTFKNKSRNSVHCRYR